MDGAKSLVICKSIQSTTCSLSASLFTAELEREPSVTGRVTFSTTVETASADALELKVVQIHHVLSTDS